MYTTGQKPGKGDYKCTNCRFVLTLDDNTDTLPLAHAALKLNLTRNRFS